MKKYLKILIPLLIVATVMIIGTSIAFADDDTLPCKTLSTSAISKPSYSTSLEAGYNSTFVVYPVVATGTGKMYIDVKADAANQYGITSAIGFMSDDDTVFNYYSSRTGYTSPDSTDTSIGCYDVVKGKTYYVGLTSVSAGAKAQVRAYIISTANNRTLKASSSYMIASSVKGSSNEDTTLSYKIKPTKTGVITVTLKNYGYSDSSGYITLLSSGKSARSEKLYYSSTSSSRKVRFGVKKGVTYYLKVTGAYGTSSQCYKYGIKYSIASATNRSLSKKSNAKTLKRKATATSTLFTANGSTETDWYKFKVTSKRKTVFKVDASEMRGTDQKLTITLYKGSTKVDSTTLYAGQSSEYTVTYGTTYGKANAGTYYIKITKTKKLSGKYKVRYVQ